MLIYTQPLLSGQLLPRGWPSNSASPVHKSSACSPLWPGHALIYMNKSLQIRHENPKKFLLLQCCHIIFFMVVQQHVKMFFARASTHWIFLISPCTVQFVSYRSPVSMVVWSSTNHFPEKV